MAIFAEILGPACESPILVSLNGQLTIVVFSESQVAGVDSSDDIGMSIFCLVLDHILFHARPDMS